jgi:hypothetical protein
MTYYINKHTLIAVVYLNTTTVGKVIDTNIIRRLIL